ncbi:RyR domain-containing protein [Butyrivibrio sp. VCB2006]|uniref:RyR domain-containing protein n=1 Tax=Butyrivibrio sp. VCB2006 TaxID=1280679 RepID=UPI0003F56390|nr:RyR domain-containing protein [Butyrivibrio sp. VCB2006]
MKIFSYIKEKCPWISYAFGLIPFIVACIGYGYYGKLPVWETVYASVALYFVNPVVDFENSLIVFAEITAVIVTAGIILSVVRYAYAKVDHFFTRLSGDATVVYTDNDFGQELGQNLSHGYTIFNNPDDDRDNLKKFKVEKVKNHILMFENDMDNVSFYTENEKKLAGSNVFMMLRDIDPSLLDTADKGASCLHFFNIYDVMARDYWRKYNLYEKRKDRIKIAIIGFGRVGTAIFKYGYLNNIYGLDQEIEYHIWGCSTSAAEFVGSLNTMNKDKIVIHEESWEEGIDCLAQMTRVIYTLQNHSIELVQKVLYVNPDAEIHCYCENPAGLAQLYISNKIVAFGDMTDILTEDNIKKEKLYRQGKLFNYDYHLRYSGENAGDDFEEKAESEWKKLNGFFKSSNIARADHYWIEKRLVSDGELEENSEDAWKIEHIRWSRFYFANHWTYDPKRDNLMRKHPLLVPYEELSYEEKSKDGVYSEVIRAEIDKLTL